MSKKLGLVLVGFWIGISSAQAGTKMFRGIPGMSCKVVKSVGGKWIGVDESEINGQMVTPIPSKANPEFSNFKYNNVWYASLNSCLQEMNASPAQSVAEPVQAAKVRDSSSFSGPKKYFVEFKAQKYLMLASGAVSDNGAVISTRTNYKSNLGIDGRLGYYLSESKILFIDVSTLGATGSVGQTGASAGTQTASDSILKINAGLQIPFKTPFIGLKPYIAGSLGYAKLSRTVSGATVPGGASSAYTASGTSVDFALEGGGLYSLSSHLDAVFDVGYTFLNFSSETIGTSNEAGFTAGGKLSDPQGYSHLLVALGLRYTL